MEIFKKSSPGGIVLCSLHIPLSKVALRYLMDNGIKLDAAIAAGYRKGPSIAVWGITEMIPAISTDQLVLFKTKSILCKGGTVIALVDKNLGLGISPNMFLLAHKLNARVVYFLSELLADGCIEVSFSESAVSDPNPQVTADLQAQELQQLVYGITSRYENRLPAR